MPLPGIDARRVTSARLTTNVLFAGPEDGTPVLFVHGNMSSATWWEEVMLALPEGMRAIAPDLRAYGGADPEALIDATRGMADFSDDLAALLDALEIGAAHLVGHSMGGCVLWQFLADQGARALSVTQVCPASPYGFSGTKPDGSLCFPDGAGSGAGGVHPEFTERLKAGDRSDATPGSPRNILNNFVWNPPFVPARIEEILDGALAQHCGPQSYPGDAVPSEHWPGFAPGKWGPMNAMSPLYQADPLAFCEITEKPPILWIHGAKDPVVSDTSLFDVGMAGQLGAIPGWPGARVFPPQPAISQTRAALERYRANGGEVREVAIEGAGHSPFLERPDAFNAAFHGALTGAR